jgi:protein-disulfide isomerase
MTRLTRPLVAAAAVALLAVAPAHAQQSFSAGQRGEIEKIVREYLVSHPEVLQEVAAELEKKQAAADADRAKSALAQYHKEIFSSPHQVTLGNPNGNVTLVEFFDYNCGYCKRTLPDMVNLLKTDPNLKVVLKEFPVLGPGSVEAAKVAVAVRMQDPDNQKYLAFHLKLLGGRGAADRARALVAAREAGVDMTRLDKDLKSPEIEATLDESKKLSDALAINGTPTFVIGDQVVPGAIGIEGLKEHIALARKPS